ncbi:hypothetical protein B0T24DRAFT_616842 [Lasiosphaeria ovina]|uniref:Uncharacterized protein n=1 Tax=Lasiosphaeria ovina TaxID=92902 RepID=A0AAE0KFF2_9PEZI|nr:hypothetical protein B0T24DRAFT_616842 [Lasiosphaeria ovina]
MPRGHGAHRATRVRRRAADQDLCACKAGVDCLERGDYARVETLARECLLFSTTQSSKEHGGGVWTTTTAKSPNACFERFRHGRYGGRRFQAVFAELRAPGGDCYWDDSRLYLRAMDTLRLVPLSPAAVLCCELEVPDPTAAQSREDTEEQTRRGEFKKRLQGRWHAAMALGAAGLDDGGGAGEVDMPGGAPVGDDKSTMPYKPQTPSYPSRRPHR